MKTLGYCGLHLFDICKPKKWKTTDIFFTEDYLVKPSGETVKISTITYMSMTYIIDAGLW